MTKFLVKSGYKLFILVCLIVQAYSADNFLGPDKNLGRTCKVFGNKIQVRLKTGNYDISKLNEQLKKSNATATFQFLKPQETFMFNMSSSLMFARNNDVSNIENIIKAEVKEKLVAENAWLKVKFEYFLNRFAPVSKIPSLQSYECVLEGRLINGISRYFLTVVVPYTSLCPCSKEISQYNAHNQRSFGHVTVELIEDQMCWIEDIVDMMEKTGSAPIINILKRPDEKWQTELMYENPVFVEDMARKVASFLDSWLDVKIKDYVFIANHEESIHLHTACSVINAGRELK